jgi:hypothetical protein
VTRMARACIDGPVFRGEAVRWDDIGTIPFDALGAPGWRPRPQAKSRPAVRPQPPGRQPAGKQSGGKPQPGRARTGRAAGRPGHGR